jgi:acyl-CoA synthetase (AMP-forming)/AMP-acid ligase II
MNPAEWLARTAALRPEAPALMRGTEVLADYAGFNRQAASLGAALVARGIGPGARVAVFMTNRPEYLVALYGAWFAGAAVVPINAKLHVREADWIIGNAGAQAVILSDDVGADLHPGNALRLSVDDPAFAALLAGDPLPAPAAMTDDALAWLFYTSGTTGRPKGVQISSGNLAAAVLSYLADVDDVLPTDAAFYAAPMSHGAGLYNFMHVIRAARHVIPPSGGFDAGEILDLAPRSRTSTCSPPPPWSAVSSPRRRRAAATARASAPSSMAAGRCISPTSPRRSRSWGRDSSRSTARAKAR